MGCFDSVLVRCPTCGTPSEFQSKSGDCLLRVYRLENCSDDVLSDVNRHAPNQCEQCTTSFRIGFRGDTPTVMAEAPLPDRSES
jgi:hypothetical protein